MVRPARSLEEWHAWQRRRTPLLKRVRTRLRRSRPTELVLVASGQHPRVLAPVDALNASHWASVVEPLRVISERAPVAALALAELASGLPPELGQPIARFDSEHLPWDRFDSVQTVVSIGAHLPCGSLGHEIALRSGIRNSVVQHGLFTPFAPPLPAEARLLAWSAADAEFANQLSPGRLEADSVGSQLLWNAAGNAGAPVRTSAAPLFLGQLHGLELGRRVTVRTVDRLAAEGRLVYRPHPAERDVLSRLQHRRWARRGIVFDADARPLPEVDRPVLGIFSTGLLEAAAARRPTWAVCADPPEWVEEMWERYSIARHGAPEPTAPPEVPQKEPASAIAELVLERV